jgi:choline dehydrogenase
MFNKIYNWGFQTEPEAELNNRRIYWPRGRTLGGSSSINGLVFIRGQLADYDRWAQLGNRGWSAAEVLPYFVKSENNERGASSHHGGDGPLRISNIGARHELMEAFIAAGAELGIPRNNDFNGAAQEGVGYFQLHTHNGLRWSTAKGYLKPALSRGNLKVETDAQATRVEFEGRRAVGVTYRQSGVERKGKARREVLLCAGSVQSPQLLQLSGVGAADLLAGKGIPVVANVPGVGKNLQDHLQVRLIYKCTKPITTNDDLRSLRRKMKIGLQWALFRSGPLGVGIQLGGMFTRALPTSRTPDIQFHFGSISADVAAGKPHDFSGFTVSMCQLRPTSRGTIVIRSANPMEPPAIRPNYLSTDHDKLVMVEGTKVARRIAETRALSGYIADEYRPGGGVRTDTEILQFVRNQGTTIFHPVGTCKMGSDPDAVVDERLSVRGVEGLRVVDASIMPTLISGNTNAAAIMIAEKAADVIRDDQNRGPVAEVQSADADKVLSAV